MANDDSVPPNVSKERDIGPMDTAAGAAIIENESSEQSSMVTTHSESDFDGEAEAKSMND